MEQIENQQRLISNVDVLIVEDDPGFRRIVATILVDEGFNVLSAADGVDALRVLQHVDPGLIVLDLHLPRMSGVELAREIKERNLTAKVVIMSGVSDPHAVREVEAVARLVKPFDLDKFLELVQNHVPQAA